MSKKFNMKYKKRHYASGNLTKGTISIPANKTINDLKSRAGDYRGTFSEYNPFAVESLHLFPGENNLIATVKKATTDPSYKKEFKLPGFKHGQAGGYHGGGFNNNSGLSFTKEQLFQIAHAMDDNDRLRIVVASVDDIDSFEEDIKTVTS